MVAEAWRALTSSGRRPLHNFIASVIPGEASVCERDPESGIRVAEGTKKTFAIASLCWIPALRVAALRLAGMTSKDG